MMKAAVFQGTGSIGIKERDIPDTRPGWVRVAVTAGASAAATCTCCMATSRRTKASSQGTKSPASSTRRRRLHYRHRHRGRARAHVGCHHCHFCDTGSANLCPETQLFGFALPGGSRSSSAFRKTPCTSSRRIEHQAAALCEPVAVCVRGMRIGSIASRSIACAILGAGTIGLLSILTAKAAGARKC